LDFAARKARALAIDRPVPISQGGVARRCVFFPAKLALWWRIPRATPPRCGRLLESPSRRSCCWVSASGRDLLGASLSHITVQSSFVAATLIGVGNTLKRSPAGAGPGGLSARPGPFRHGEDVVKSRRHRGGTRRSGDRRGGAARFVHSLHLPELL